ncbi:MAG TPA: TIGR03986 family CRISPR-associated RAMP protein [Candidatus Dormibacteraeota bacterium]|nr:TIGR03986 family CRISPR-associated RAMP protein [Candidatus Dormibacteraeota bacterium]
MSEGFHNPYTFIPLLDRSRLDKSPLGDRGPLGHDRDVPSAWNAHLRVVLTVHTPLLLLDPARATRDRSGHQTYPVRLDAAGRPYLAPTAVKGMLRSAYEVVTNSRLGVFWGRETLKVGGRPSRRSPRDLLQTTLPSLLPATRPEELSPADRVFGWVAESRTGREVGTAHRGQLRLGPVRWLEGAPVTFPEPLPLAILSSPKPNQVRFYLGDLRQGRSVAQPDGRNDVQAGYDEAGRTLRGRKVYPHHADLEGREEHWREPWAASWSTPVRGRYREYLRPEGRRDDQNRSITGWVPPGARFAFEIRVWNLAAVELGSLIWLLELPDSCRLRLGAGKPLGFGSVRLRLRREESTVIEGEEVAERYRTLGATGPPTDPERFELLIKTFKREVCRAYTRTEFEKVPFIAAFLAAAEGRRGPIHYPRLGQRPDPAGKNFQWFQANARGRRVALPEATSSDPLPYEPGPRNPRH